MLLLACAKVEYSLSGIQYMDEYWCQRSTPLGRPSDHPSHGSSPQPTGTTVESGLSSDKVGSFFFLDRASASVTCIGHTMPGAGFENGLVFENAIFSLLPCTWGFTILGISAYSIYQCVSGLFLKKIGRVLVNLLQE
jgi:hypothetical protein